MATLDYLKERVEMGNEKIEKLQKTISKKQVLIEKKKKELESLTDSNERYWKNCDIESLESDLYHRNKDLAQAEETLAKWQNQLDAENSKERGIPVLVEFLNNWKENVRKYYTDLHLDVTGERKRIKNEIKEISPKYEEFRDKTRMMLSWTNRPYPKYEKEYNAIVSQYKDIINKMHMLKNKYNDIYSYVEEVENMVSKTSFDYVLENILKNEWNVRYDDLVNRVGTITGEIIDCNYLHINDTGMLDGTVIGKKGKAKVNTIGAGGWNIQRFHYRVLVRKI